jgi:mRNA interferase RelE/StbE
MDTIETSRPPWALHTAAAFDRSLSSLDRQVARRILDYLYAVVALGDPRSRGRGLTGDLAGLWRFRVGDYRILRRAK